VDVDATICRAVDRAEKEFKSVVRDPSPRVDHYIRSAEGLGWDWTDEYKKDKQFEWCGAFAAFCHTAVLPEIRKKHFPSTYRLYTWAKGTPRMIPLEDIQPGDICITSTANTKKKWGQHITLCVEVLDEEYIRTIEGNAWGHLPDGEYAQGVVTRKRCLVKGREASWVSHAYKLLAEDFQQ